MRYLVAPESRADALGGRIPGRTCLLETHYPPQQAGQPEPWSTCETAGGYFLAWTDLPVTGLPTGCVALPDAPITARLRDFSPQERQTLRDIWAAMKLDGAALTDLDLMFGDVQLGMVGVRQAPRYDAPSDTFVHDGDPMPQQKPLPWQAAGGAFPTTTLKDDFNRANGPVGSNWSLLFTSAGINVATNQAVNDGVTAFGEMYWNVATYGPDAEVYCTWANVVASNEQALWTNVHGTLPNSFNGYFLESFQANSANALRRMTGGTSTILTPTFTYGTAPASGHIFGLERAGASLSAYQNTGGGWGAATATRLDSTYSVAGYIGLSTQSTSDKQDNFSGGTLTPAPYAITPAWDHKTRRGNYNDLWYS